MAGGRNVRKVMSRLSPSSMPLIVSGSRGTGEPELTAIDIAHALAAANGDRRRRLAIDVLCLRWWPARMEGPMIVVGHRKEVRTCPAGKSTTILLPVERPAETPPFVALASLVGRSLSDHAGHRIKDEKTAVKVLEPAFVERWARVVIDEYRNPNVCAVCRHHGRPGEVPKAVTDGEKVVRFEWSLCEDCGGTGAVPWGKFRRAKGVKIAEHTFRQHLNESHDGALSLLRELERRAVRYVGRNFSDS